MKKKKKKDYYSSSELVSSICSISSPSTNILLKMNFQYQ